MTTMLNPQSLWKSVWNSRFLRGSISSA